MTDADNELAGYRARKRLGELLNELEITGTVREQMLAEPERALEVLGKATRARGIRNRAAFAITRWRQLQARPEPPAPPLEPVLLGQPPDLDALEYVWSRPATVMTELVSKLQATSIERHGGFAALHASFEKRRLHS